MKKQMKLFRPRLMTRMFVLSLVVVFSSAFTNPDIDTETVKAGYFKTYSGVTTFFSKDFDFDFKCGIQSYEVMYQAPRKDVIIFKNDGGRFAPALQRVVKNAKAGDVFTFTKIRARCEGDPANRKLPSLVVRLR